MSPEAFPADPDLPQLKVASDPRLMLEVFQRHLQPLTGKACHIQDCLLSRVRYRRAARCVLQYTLHLVELDTGREQSQWVAGVIYAEGRAGRIWKKLQAGGVAQRIPETMLTFKPVSFIPDLEMLVQVFPNDRRLPSLPLLMAGPSPDLAALLLTHFGLGDWRAETWSTEPIRYRAELGAVLQYSVLARDAATGGSVERRFYAKVYHDDEGGRTYQALQSLSARVDAGGAGFIVAKPIIYLSDLHALFQEGVPGTPLQQVLFQGRDTALVMRRVARALAALHLDQVATMRHYGLQDEVAALKRAGQLLQWTCPHLGTAVEVIIGAVVAGLEDVPPCPTHGDLKADHILLDGDRLALLDLDCFAQADPILDSATFLAQLAGMTLRFPVPHEQVRTDARTFAEEYFALVPRGWRSRLPLYYAGAVLKVAVGFFRRQEPCWPEKIAALVEEARGSLAGEIW